MSAGSDKFSVTPDKSGNVTIRFYDDVMRQLAKVNFDPPAFAEFAAVIHDVNHASLTATVKR